MNLCLIFAKMIVFMHFIELLIGISAVLLAVASGVLLVLKAAGGDAGK